MSHRLSTRTLWQTQWRVLLLRHRRVFSKLDKFGSERNRWHDCAAVPQSFISNANADMHTEMTAVEEKTAVTPSVAVINPDSVAKSKSLHYMLTMLVDGLALDIIVNSGQCEGYESWRRLALEYHLRSRVHAAGSVMEILSHHFTLDASSFEAFEAQRSQCTSAGRQTPLVM